MSTAKMAKMLGVKIRDSLDERFRKTVFDTRGMRKGNLTTALEESIELWIEKEEKEKRKKRKAEGEK